MMGKNGSRSMRHETPFNKATLHVGKVEFDGGLIDSRIRAGRYSWNVWNESLNIGFEQHGLP